MPENHRYKWQPVEPESPCQYQAALPDIELRNVYRLAWVPVSLHRFLSQRQNRQVGQ